MAAADGASKAIREDMHPEDSTVVSKLQHVCVAALSLLHSKGE